MKIPSFLESKLLKTVALFSVIGFTAISLASATVAWFSANRRVNGNEQHVDSFYEDIQAQFDLYQYDPDTSYGTNVDKNGNKFDITNGKYTFLPYDSIFKSRNVFTPSLLRITITGANISKVNGTVKISIKHDSSLDGTDGKLSEYFTSAMDFRFGTGELAIGRSSMTRMFLDAMKYFRGENEDYPNPPEAHNFVLKESGEWKDPWEKAETLEIETTYTEDNWVTVAGVKTLYVYLFMDYNEDLADNFLPSTITEEGLEGNTINLNNDLTEIAMSYSNHIR